MMTQEKYMEHVNSITESLELQYAALVMSHINDEALSFITDNVNVKYYNWKPEWLAAARAELKRRINCIVLEDGHE